MRLHDVFICIVPFHDTLLMSASKYWGKTDVSSMVLESYQLADITMVNIAMGGSVHDVACMCFRIGATIFATACLKCEFNSMT